MGAYLLLAIDDLLRERDLPRSALSAAARGPHPDGDGALSEAALSRLWAGDAAAPRKGWDHFVATCSTVLEVPPLRIWETALGSWKKDPTGEVPKSLRRIAQNGDDLK